MATIIEQLQALLDKDTSAKLKAAVALHPELLVDDAFAALIMDIYNGAPEEVAAAATTTTAAAASAPVTTAAVHTPTVPTTATAAPVVVAPASTTTTSNNSEILAALNGLKSTMEANFKNVVTKEQLPELGQQMTSNAIRQAHLTMQVENMHRQTFGTDLDLDTVAKFIADEKAAGRTYHDVKAAYLAMPDVSAKMDEARISKKVDEQVKQKLSAATVPGQTTSVSLSAAQQVMAKSKADANGAGGKTRIQEAIDKLAARERARESGGEMVQ